MKILDNRFDRSERLFGKEGQERINQTTVAIVGAGGGLGTHVVQHDIQMAKNNLDNTKNHGRTCICKFVRKKK